MIVQYDNLTFPERAQLGERVNISVTIHNVDPFGVFYRCGVSIKDQRGVPFIVWDYIDDPIWGYSYESPVVSFFLMPNQPITFYGHYYQVEETEYPAEVRLHWREANAPTGTPWTTEGTIYQFTVSLQATYYSLEARVMSGSGNVNTESNMVLAGSNTTVTAIPAANQALDHWRVIIGSQVTTHNGNPLTFRMEGNTIVEAYFRDATVPPAYYSLHVQSSGGNGTWSGAGVDELFEPGHTVTLTAQPSNGYDFVKWVVNGQSFSTPTISFYMNADKTATVFFKAHGTTPPPSTGGNVGLIVAAVVIAAALALSDQKRK